jgi:hypothetical protein
LRRHRVSNSSKGSRATGRSQPLEIGIVEGSAPDDDGGDALVAFRQGAHRSHQDDVAARIIDADTVQSLHRQAHHAVGLAGQLAVTPARKGHHTVGRQPLEKELPGLRRVERVLVKVKAPVAVAARCRSRTPG